MTLHEHFLVELGAMGALHAQISARLCAGTGRGRGDSPYSIGHKRGGLEGLATLSVCTAMLEAKPPNPFQRTAVPLKAQICHYL